MEIYNIDDENQIIISKVEKGTLETLKNSINWTQPVVNIFGRTYYPKRQVCTMGKPYKYNGNITDEEIPIIDCVKEIMEEVNTKCNCNFNTCVANYYEDGEDLKVNDKSYLINIGGKIEKKKVTKFQYTGIFFIPKNLRKELIETYNHFGEDNTCYMWPKPGDPDYIGDEDEDEDEYHVDDY